jgi:hypothetical protein
MAQKLQGIPTPSQEASFTIDQVVEALYAARLNVEIIDR